MEEPDTGDENLVNRLRTSLIAHSLWTGNKDEEQLLNKLKGLVTNIKWNPAAVTELFVALLQRFESTTKDRSHLLSWLLEMLHHIEIYFITPSWKYQKRKSLIDMVLDETVIDENFKRCLADDEEKKLDEILDEIRQQKLNQVDEQLLENVRDIVSSVDEDLRSQNDGSQRTGLKKDLLRLCQAVEKTHFRPRLTQMVSWCIMALSKTGRLIQVGTGEGKSCIVAMFAAYRAMKGESVDIMSSSSVLAERDYGEWKKFYEKLKIKVSCNINKYGKSRQKCYGCQVVYGCLSKFAGDWLRHHFHRMDIFGKRTFQCAIVDEVDSLMLDKGLHVVYLSSDMPALQHLNPLLAFIWATANQYSEIGTRITVGPKYSFPHVVLKNITKGKDIDEFTILQMAEDTGVLAKGSVKDLRKNLSLLTEKTASVSVNQMAEFFKTVERRFPSCQFVLHCMNNDGSVEELNNRPQRETSERQRVPLLLTDGGFCQYIYTDRESMLSDAEAEIKRGMDFTPCELNQDKCKCYVPGFLADLVKCKLKVWIENAFYAQTMTEDHHYIIEKHGIVPVDYRCTGVVENNMRWSDGLHQFLEMKHQFKLSDMTTITNYMSNVGLLQKYGDQIFGISGTLGQQAETETLQKIYGDINVCQIPSFKRRKLFEVEGVIVDDEKQWIEKICKTITNHTQRAVLVICETISRAKVLHSAPGDKVQTKRLYISNNMDNTEILDKKLDAGDVIVATNLAGRGTDLQVSEKVKEAGGLFVVQTFLPKNARVEAQAFGRAARQGSPGSAQLIVCSSHLPKKLQELDLRRKKKSRILPKNSNSVITTVKKARDGLVAKTLASYLKYDIPKIKKKEELFSQYLNVLDEVYKSSNNKPSESDVSALNEFWGLWLLTRFSENESIMDLTTKLTTDLQTAREKLKQRESPSSNLHHYTAFGNELRKKGDLNESIKMYTKAIQQDHCWAAIAYYNRAFTSLAQQDRHQQPDCFNEALQDLQNALKSVELYCDQIEVICRYSKQQTKILHSDSDNRFKNHMDVRQEVLLCFKANINEAIRELERARDTGGDVELSEKPLYFLISAARFIPMVGRALLSSYQIFSRDPVKMQQLISDQSFDISNELSYLKSLGLTQVYTLNKLSFFSRFFSKIKSLFSALYRLIEWLATQIMRALPSLMG